MSITIGIHDKLTKVDVRKYSEGGAGIALEFAPKVFGNGMANDNCITLFFDDSVLAHRIGLDIAYRLKERRDELAREQIAEAAE